MPKIVLEAKVIVEMAEWVTDQSNLKVEGKEVEIDLLSGSVTLYDRNEGGMAISGRAMSYFT